MVRGKKASLLALPFLNSGSDSDLRRAHKENRNSSLSRSPRRGARPWPRLREGSQQQRRRRWRPHRRRRLFASREVFLIVCFFSVFLSLSLRRPAFHFLRSKQPKIKRRRLCSLKKKTLLDTANQHNVPLPAPPEGSPNNSGLVSAEGRRNEQARSPALPPPPRHRRRPACFLLVRLVVVELIARPRAALSVVLSPGL